jgi:hypothetical protein
VAHCAAGVDDVGHIAFTLGGLRPNKRLARPAENP